MAELLKLNNIILQGVDSTIQVVLWHDQAFKCSKELHCFCLSIGMCHLDDFLTMFLENNTTPTKT